MRYLIAAAISAGIVVLASEPAVTAATKDPVSMAVTEKVISPEEKMNSRFPQPVKVGDLIGLPVLDGQDRTLGYVEDVMRSSEGKIRFVVPYSSWLGWPRHLGPLRSLRRPVAVPIEVVVILARQIDALDMDRSEFDKAPTWAPQDEMSIPREEVIRIAIGRR